jgi:hypothetical protein
MEDEVTMGRIMGLAGELLPKLICKLEPIVESLKKLIVGFNYKYNL